jgi:glycosyltransferase involved in cell wall biosynthesis
MAAGKAAIGCYGQGIEEIIESGVNGMLFHPGDLQELIVKIDRLLQDDALRDRIGRAARQTILNRYTVQHQAEQLAEAYRRCLE